MVQADRRTRVAWRQRTGSRAQALMVGGTVFVGAIGLTLAAAGSAGAASARDPITAAQVALHASSVDCWVSINDRVYDLTRWIARHPGGSAAIVGLCGTDGTSAFQSAHEGQRAPARALARFIVGPLAGGASTPTSGASPSATPSATPSTGRPRPGHEVGEHGRGEHGRGQVGQVDHDDDDHDDQDEHVTGRGEPDDD